MLKKQKFFSLSLLAMATALCADVVNLGSNRELFVDDKMIEKMDNAEIRLNRPDEKDIVFVLDREHEGNVSCYFTIMKDGDKYRMYYNGSHYNLWNLIGANRKGHHEFTCLAESTDGINWTRPILNKVEFNGSKANNILDIPPHLTHCFTPFKDTNPDCPPDELYKAAAGVQFNAAKPGKLYGMVSPDGINWKLVQEKPILDKGEFDSQNLIFYDNVRKCYVAYYRRWVGRMRGIATATSKDFRNWTEGEMLSYDNNKDENFYTNAILRYGDTQYLLGFPMLFRDDRTRNGNWRIGLGDGGFMSSRDGKNFYLFEEAFLRPGLNNDRWYNRCNYASWGMIETPINMPGNNSELSLYYSEGYSESDDLKIRRCTIRKDGFASIHSNMKKGTVLTKAFTFAETPKELQKNSESDLYKTKVIIKQGGSINYIHHHGKGVLYAPYPISQEIPDTDKLGKSATFAIQVDRLERGKERRFFSSYDRFNKNAQMFYFHIYLAPHKSIYKDSLLRCYYSPFGKAEFKGEALEAEIAKSTHHHFAATIDHGKIKLYMNGKLVAENNVEYKDMAINSTLGNLRFGCDYPPYGMLYSPFLGYADDLLILKRAMSAKEIAELAENGAEKTLNLEKEEGVLYTMETEKTVPLIDRLAKDGVQNSFYPNYAPFGKTMLILNCSTSARGSIRVELQDAETGKAIPGYSLEDCDLIYDDSLNRTVTWGGNADVSQLANRPIKILFELKDADIFSYRFGQ